MSPAAWRRRALLRQLAEIYRTHLVYPAAICSQSRILARGDDCSAPCTDLAGGMRLVVFRIEVLQLSILAVVLYYLALGRILAILRQDTSLGLLPEALFLAVLGHHAHHAPRVRDRRAFPWHPSLTLAVATNSHRRQDSVLLHGLPASS